MFYRIVSCSIIMFEETVTIPTMTRTTSSRSEQCLKILLLIIAVFNVIVWLLISIFAIITIVTTDGHAVTGITSDVIILLLFFAIALTLSLMQVYSIFTEYFIAIAMFSCFELLVSFAFAYAKSYIGCGLLAIFGLLMMFYAFRIRRKRAREELEDSLV